jgi:sugar O-acyltransferase (sialic acid O-acetyltransferase NeuD family)
MPTERWIVVGAGGHARVVMDAVLHDGRDPAQIAFADDDVSLHGTRVLGRPIIGLVKAVVGAAVSFHVAVGSNRVRETLHRQLLEVGASPFNVVHPMACISPFASLGQGSFVAARAVIAPAATIGAAVIINHGAVVDHDVVVGDYAHIAPGVTLGGGVRVGRGALVGAGAILLPGVSIGDGAVVGAGAVVLADVAFASVVVGVPARVQRKFQQ